MCSGQSGGMREVIVETIRRGAGIGTLFVAAAFIAMVVPEMRGISELILEPGYLLPRAYWGGVHDALQILVVAGLNCVFYGAIFSAVLWPWRKKG